MTEPIEQLVVRLADEHLRYQIEDTEVSGVIAFAKACMLHQAEVDAEIAKGYDDGREANYADIVADAILKAAEELNGTL